MIFFKHNKKKAIIHIKECILLGSSATGKSREFPVPFSDITGGELLDALLIDGKLAESYENSFSDEEIYTALLKCQRSLNKNCNFFYPNYPEGCKGCFTGFSSKRQICCLENTIKLIINGKYNHALHEFEDCIDDYGKGRERKINREEYVLYNYILICFIASLEKHLNGGTKL